MDAKQQVEDTGCCEDLKAAFAHVDKFVLKAYFQVPKGGKKGAGLEEPKTGLEYNFCLHFC